MSDTLALRRSAKELTKQKVFVYTTLRLFFGFFPLTLHPIANMGLYLAVRRAHEKI